MTEMTDRFVLSIQDAMDGIIHFWTEKMQDPRGGFFGRMNSRGEIDETAPKSTVLNSRILWAMSAAYGACKKEEYLLAATKAKDYFTENFLDHKHGGVYWSLDTDNKRLDARKQTYAQSFAIYAICEYIKVTHDTSALIFAKNLYRMMEEKLRDRENGGYVEFLERDWSEGVNSTVKTLGTQIHALEALSSLYAVWPNKDVRESLISLLNVFVEKIYNAETEHFDFKFDRNWNVLCDCCSFGHELEASWILVEAAFRAGDIELSNKVRKVADAAFNGGIRGLQPDGSVIKSVRADGSLDTDRYWWVQAEAVVACMYVWKYKGCPKAAHKAIRCWEFIKKNLISKEGEWYRRCTADGSVCNDDIVAGDKGPYHDTRMCVEVLSILR